MTNSAPATGEPSTYHDGTGAAVRASFDKIHSYLGFGCQKTVEFGIREIFEAIQSRRISDFTASRFYNQLAAQTFAESASAAQSSMRVMAKLVA